MTSTDLAGRVRSGRPADPSRGTLRPLGLGEVTITGGFLGGLQQRNHDVSLAHVEYWLEREGWLGNFDAAVEGRLPADRRGREFADTEIYKLLEALAWEYGRTRDSGINDRFERIAARVVAAQEPDGYLNTYFGRPGQPERYSDLEWGHELYSFGHLIQAGVARARTTGEDDFVRAVRRAADHVCATFGPDGIQSVCGHPEIEPALVELYRVTGERRYLEQARLFVERRGHQTLDDIAYGRSYFQDDVPVRDADVLRGHAVRALYLSAGATDVAVETDDADLLAALRRQWDATIARRTYLTGGMGSRHQDEAFGEDFVLPADRAYSETCAGVGSIMFSWRLLLASGDARYADLIERTLYNVVATSPSRDGKRFFYANTLHLRELGRRARRRSGGGAAGVRPARALVRRRLLPDQPGPHLRQPGRVRRLGGRHRGPAAPVRPGHDPHRVAGRAGGRPGGGDRLPAGRPHRRPDRRPERSGRGPWRCGSRTGPPARPPSR